jgi:putative FmdB family regulatory protein
MPVYDRKCGSCDELFEVTCKISEKSNTHECPYCGGTDGEWQISAPALSASSSRMGTTTDKKSGFHEVVQKIAKTYPRSELAKRV